MTALVVALAVVVGLLAVLVAGLLRSHADILRALHELGVGLEEHGPPAPRRRPRASAAEGRPTHTTVGEAPEIRTQPGVPEPRTDATSRAVDIAGATPDGGVARIGVVGVPNSTLVAFLSTGCLTCADFWRAFAAEGDLGLPGVDTRLVVVTRGPTDESTSAVRELAPPRITTVMSTDAWEDYGVPVSPYFLLVDGPSGSVVGEGAAHTWEQVSTLLSKAVADAGLNPTGRTRREFLAGGREREDRADRELSAAGIEPGHPSLYPPTPPRGSDEVASEGVGSESIGSDGVASEGVAPAVGDRAVEHRS